MCSGFAPDAPAPASDQEMKACVSYWTVGCVKPRKDNKPPRLTDSRYVSASGEVRDYSMHCMIDDHVTAVDFANMIRPDVRQQDPSCQVVVEQVNILISQQEKKRLERRIAQQSATVKKFLAGRFADF